MPDADQNGDGVIDAADCDVAPANNPPQETPRVAPVATTETAAETPPAVLAADDTRPTAVLGETLAQPEVAGATLARTGPSQLGALGMSGGLLVAAGLVATVWGRRRVVV
jgi:hypothetical protein